MFMPDDRKQGLSNIHPTAIVAPEAQLGNNVTIGPYCIIGPQVKLGDNVTLMSHVVIQGNTSLGDNNIVYAFACLGHAPQDLTYKGEESQLIIGSHNYIGCNVTMNGGTNKGGLVTRIGNHCMFMACSHVGHDTQIGNHVVMANNVLLAGHVIIGNNVILGGDAAVTQRVRVGNGAMVTAHTTIEKDLIPYGYATGFRAVLRGLNLIGMKRLNIDKTEIRETLKAYKQLFNEHNEEVFQERLNDVKNAYPANKQVQEIVTFLDGSTRGKICTPDIKDHDDPDNC